MIKVIVRLTGARETAVSVELNPEWTLEQCKPVIREALHSTASDHRAVFKGRVLSDDTRIASLNITPRDSIIVCPTKAKARAPPPKLAEPPPQAAPPPPDPASPPPPTPASADRPSPASTQPTFPPAESTAQAASPPKPTSQAASPPKPTADAARSRSPPPQPAPSPEQPPAPSAQPEPSPPEPELSPMEKILKAARAIRDEKVMLAPFNRAEVEEIRRLERLGNHPLSHVVQVFMRANQNPQVAAWALST